MRGGAKFHLDRTQTVEICLQSQLQDYICYLVVLVIPTLLHPSPPWPNNSLCRLQPSKIQDAESVLGEIKIRTEPLEEESCVADPGTGWHTTSIETPLALKERLLYSTLHTLKSVHCTLYTMDCVFCTLLYTLHSAHTADIWARRAGPPQ